MERTLVPKKTMLRPRARGRQAFGEPLIPLHVQFMAETPGVRAYLGWCLPNAHSGRVWFG